jgi:hypothetical protein
MVKVEEAILLGQPLSYIMSRTEALLKYGCKPGWKIEKFWLTKKRKPIRVKRDQVSPITK